MKRFAALLAALVAAEISGAWTLQYDKDFSGHPASHKCTLQQHGDKLSGTCDGEMKLTGEVKDGKVTFEHTTGRNHDITVHYDAVVDKDATFMKGTWRYVDPTDKKPRIGRFGLSKE